MRLAALIGALLVSACAHEPFDLVIRGGEVFDGTGGRSQRVDVGIRQDRIAQLGDLRKEPARRVLDAKGFVVAPGFIELAGVKGAGAPAAGTTAHIGRAEDSAAPSEINHGFFTTLSAEKVSAGTVDEAMRRGALGLSLALGYGDDAPERREELVSIVKVVAQRGGILLVDARPHADGADGLAQRVAWATELADRGALPLLFCPALPAELWAESVDAARARNLEVTQCPAQEAPSGLADAIHRRTSLLAQQMGLLERGLVKEGYFADLVVLERPLDTSLAAPNVRFLIVGGSVSVDRGKVTGARAGRRIYGPGFERPSKPVRGGLGAETSGSP